MSMQSINSVDIPHTNKTKSHSKVVFSSASRSQKSATISSLQMGQANRQDSVRTNAREHKYIHYPSPVPDYEAKRCPPDLANAMKHRLAHGISPLESLLASTEVCESTGVPFANRKIPLTAPLSQLYHLGPVFPMYFLLIKQISVIMIFLCILAVAIAILQFKGTAHPTGYIDYISNLYKNELQTTVLVMGSLCILLALILILHNFRRRQKSIKMNCKVGNLSPSDYTIMSANLADSLSEEELKTFFSNFIVPGYSLDVVKVTKTCDIDRYIWEVRKLSKLINKKQKISQNAENEKISVQIEDLDKEIEESNQFFARRKTFLSSFKLLRKNDICFVTFNTRLEAKAVRRRFELSPAQRFFLSIRNFLSRDLNEYYLNNNFVSIQKAPEPGEIIWENMQRPKQSCWFAMIYIILCLIVFAITGFGLWELNSLQLSYSEWCIGLLVAVTNGLFSWVVSAMALWENFLTITEKRITLTYRLIFLQLVNMIVPVYIFDLMEPNLNPNALPFYVLCIAIISFALPLLIRLINVRYILKAFSRLRAQLQDTSCPLTQEEANHLFEDPELNISALYSNLLKTLMFCCFGFSVSPGVVFVGLVALILMYWIDKYNLLRKSLIPSYMRSELAEAMNECLEVAMFLLALGNLVWSLFMVRNSSSVSDGLIIMLGASIFEVLLTFVYMLLPNKKMNRGWFPLEKRSSSWSGNLFYQQAIEYFQSNYNLCSLPSELRMEPQDLKEHYKITDEKYNCIETLKDCPEILPMFEYADKHPSFFQIWFQGLTGLKDPYYIYPQNYGYGLVQLLVLNLDNRTENKIPLLQEVEAQRRKKGANTVVTPYLGKRNTELPPAYPYLQKRDTRDLVNMMTEMVKTNYDSERLKASTIYSQRAEELKAQDEFARKKQGSDAHNTLIFDSFRNEVLTAPSADNSILGMSPINDNNLLKTNSNVGKVNPR